MLFAAIILICISIRSLHALDFAENEDYDLLASWGIKTAQADKQEKIKNKFIDNSPTSITCDELYQLEEIPFIAIILFKSSGRLMCMGSIIDRRHILSCKKCYLKTDASDLVVVVGYAKPWWGRYSQIRKVLKIIRHEYEVALLKLKDKIEYTQYVKATKLPPPVAKTSEEVIATYPPPYFVVGFAVDRFDVPGDFLSKDRVCQIKQDTYVSLDDCKANYTKLLIETKKLFCTLGNATYCWGGLGSPVLKKLKAHYLQIGVVIADNCTAETTGPFLVARTDVYGEWIYRSANAGHQPS